MEYITPSFVREPWYRPFIAPSTIDSLFAMVCYISFSFVLLLLLLLFAFISSRIHAYIHIYIYTHFTGCIAPIIVLSSHALVLLLSRLPKVLSSFIQMLKLLLAILSHTSTYHALMTLSLPHTQIHTYIHIHTYTTRLLSLSIIAN